MTAKSLYVGCAGWSIGRDYLPVFTEGGTHLERYASRLTGVEINSSFYRSHRPQTYAKWAASVGADFRFSVKVPKSITHEYRLHNCEPLLDAFLSECSSLGSHLSCLLIQVPPSLTFDSSIVGHFFQALRDRFEGYVIIEPRHETWTRAEQLLIDHRIAQASVNPSRISGDKEPRGWLGIRYWRLHGSPTIYYSPYERAWLEDRATKIQQTLSAGVPTWCIFDNTASGAAMGNALTMLELLQME
ncbi:DUF72 domain-containing protein [Pseudomonas sp. NA-150]|uniref:DUF72 domain-containing protein n=1 Tax=Pseudomonas sp. NA-150 TaxID=3367525 RepID=UPI0037C9DD8E